MEYKSYKWKLLWSQQLAAIFQPDSLGPLAKSNCFDAAGAPSHWKTLKACSKSKLCELSQFNFLGLEEKLISPHLCIWKWLQASEIIVFSISFLKKCPKTKCHTTTAGIQSNHVWCRLAAAISMGEILVNRSFKKKGKRLSRNQVKKKRNHEVFLNLMEIEVFPWSVWCSWCSWCSWTWSSHVFSFSEASENPPPFPPLGTARGRLTTGPFSSQMLQVANWVDSARWRSWDVQDQQVMQKTGTQRFPILEEKASQLKLKTKVSCDAVPNSRYLSLSAPCDQLAASRYVSSQSKHIFSTFFILFSFQIIQHSSAYFFGISLSVYTYDDCDCSIKSHESCLANDCDMRCIWYGVNCVELCELLSFEAAGYVPFKVLLPLAQICGIFGLPKIKTHQKISSDSEITSKNTISIGFMYIHIVLWIGDPWVSISTCNAIWSFPASRHHSQTLVPLADRVWVPNCSVTHRQGNTRIFYHIKV